MALLPPRAGALPGRRGKRGREAPLDLFEHKFGYSSTHWDLRSKVPAGSDKTGRGRAGGNLAYATRVRSGPELRELSPEQFTAELAGRMSIMERHAGNPAFRAVVAVRPGPADGRRPLIGFAYGFHGSAGQWWHDVVTDSLTARRGREAAGLWLGDSFEFAEVHVHPDHQARGTGRAMMHTLAAGRPERTAVLSTPHGQTRARRLYSSLGFVDLLPAFSFPGAGPAYAIMGAALPLRGAPA